MQNTEFFSFLANTLWYHTHKDTKHKQGPIDWNNHINMYLLCAYSSYLDYIEWIIHWSQNFNLQAPYCFYFSKITLVEATHLLISFNKSKFFLWNTKNSDRTGANKQNTHRDQTLRER